MTDDWVLMDIKNESNKIVGSLLIKSVNGEDITKEVKVTKIKDNICIMNDRNKIFKGWIDQIRIYNKIVSAKELEAQRVKWVKEKKEIVIFT